jgi:hypothetical protein
LQASLEGLKDGPVVEVGKLLSETLQVPERVLVDQADEAEQLEE